MKRKEIIKRRLCEAHRKERYDYAIEQLIKGEVSPNYVTYRWRKLKQVRGE